jgi:two-component system phosphate regulon response regulator OmpR
MSKHCVLIVDDNNEMRDVVREGLEGEGYTVFAATTGREAISILQVKRADTILLDLVLPDADGLSLISGIRKLTDAPVIVVSGKGGWVDKVVGLEMGADDYIGKPFELKELLARVKASVRRYRSAAAAKQAPEEKTRRVKFASLTLDSSKFQVFDAGGKSCNLTAMEFRLLEALVLSATRVLSREQLLDKAHAGDLAVNDRAIDIQITRIRKKINDDPKEPRIIKTVRGVGYVLDCPTETLADD